MSASIDKLYERVMNVVEESHKLLSAPQVSDMEHIKTEVQAMCIEIEALPVEERVQYADKFGQLFEALGGLEEGLRGKRDAIGEALSGTNEHKKANSAYVKISHIDSKPKD